ncbi:Uncharacterised protein [Klebsiella pneumoniae]|nr:Uncharacterised protein [Klebsiella pneumoniae]
MFAVLKCQCHHVTFLMVFDQTFQLFPPVEFAATAVFKLNKETLSFAGCIFSTTKIVQYGSHALSRAKFSWWFFVWCHICRFAWFSR